MRHRTAATISAIAVLAVAAALVPQSGRAPSAHPAEGGTRNLDSSTARAAPTTGTQTEEPAPVLRDDLATPSIQNTSEPAGGGTSSRRIEGSFIVALAPGADPHEVAAEHGGEVVHVYDEVVGGFSFRGPDEVREAQRHADYAYRLAVPA